MKFTFMRRGVAAIAAASLITIGAPVVTAANAADACALGATCEGVLSGSLGDSPFEIQMPENFNGTVLLYSHGYRFSGPIPAIFSGPTALGVAANPDYDMVRVPSLAANFGTDVAYKASNRPNVAPSAAVAQNLLTQGYALAGAGYANQGWASNEGVEAGENLIRHINSGAIPKTKKIMVWGNSLGGLITQTIAERNPGKVAGSLPSCGVLEGPLQAYSSAMTLMFTWKTLIAPTLKVTNYTPGAVGYGEALTDLATVFQTLTAVAGNPSLKSSVGVPVAQANLLAGLMGGLPTNSSVYDGLTTNPVIDVLAQNPEIGPGKAPAAANAAGYSPVSSGQSSAAAMLQNVGYAAALGILGRYDLESRMLLSGAVAPGEVTNFNDNVNVSYSKLLSPEQSGQFGDTLNATTAISDPLNSMLAALDVSRGNPAVRFPANPKAVKFVNSLAAPKGIYSVPTLLLSDTYDPAVPAGNTGEFFASMAKSYNKMNKKKRGLFKAAAFYTIPPVDGWTKFAPGGKAPDAALSIAALGNSGVGHCEYTTEQLLGAVRGLNAMVNAKSAKQVTAAKRIVFAVPGVNKDRLFLPDPLKKPLLAR